MDVTWSCSSLVDGKMCPTNLETFENMGLPTPSPPRERNSYVSRLPESIFMQRPKKISGHFISIERLWADRIVHFFTDGRDSKFLESNWTDIVAYWLYFNLYQELHFYLYFGTYTPSLLNHLSYFYVWNPHVSLFCSKAAFFKNSTHVGPTDGRTDGQTHPLVTEMREQI